VSVFLMTLLIASSTRVIGAGAAPPRETWRDAGHLRDHFFGLERRSHAEHTAMVRSKRFENWDAFPYRRHL
jgi:hypothetical protein